MNKRVSLRLAAAIFVAVAGLIVAGRQLWPSSKHGPASVEVAPTPAVSKVLDGVFDTRPTAETVMDDIGRAGEAAGRSLSSSTVPPALRTDLVAAFEERLAAVIAPDAARDLQFRIARGQQNESDQPSEEQIQAGKGSARLFGLRPMNLSEIVVRPIWSGGRLVNNSLDEIGAGFATTSTRYGGPLAFPMADKDPEKDRLEIVEIRLPIEMPIPPPDQGRYERQLVGFQFVWSKERNQWIPWQNMTYGKPGHGSFGTPL
jgi:hypothetical protein